ncbi:outer membrane beta-barrel protein [Tenacibaculum sp. M341]|uniref:outer membrane beta-barrel protein n=1 Tax=Tenacibaculum sp. M341 TaxID=2530339 RepID=UPI001046102B|nr:outer membrane beta-barrel protein [Tenacibaculum sp. M341]TCI91713.1 hypothetical protein EYW44_09140 [Tenacibaculum sp. M341]
MKKLFFIITIALGLSMNAQEGQFNLGANFGLPTGNYSNITSFALSVEANYLFDISENISVGPSASFINYFGKEENNVGFGDIQFLPLAAAGRFNISDEFTLGADIGYGIGINTGNDGGFYYRPMLAYNISDDISLQASYSGISSNGQNISNVGLGVMFKL